MDLRWAIKTNHRNSSPRGEGLDLCRQEKVRKRGIRGNEEMGYKGFPVDPFSTKSETRPVIV